MVPSAAMTRSFINPKDRAAEVARRRQEAEEELRRRREERIRRIEEKAAKALANKQNCLAEKSNKTKAEIEHLREVNKRRIEKEKSEHQRLQEMLEKRKSPPRMSQSVHKPKAPIAFGSSLPQVLNVPKNNGGRSASTASVNGSPPNTLMTRSVHPVLSSSKPKEKRPIVNRPAKPPVVQPIKPVQRTPPQRSKPNNAMSRSVHPALCPTPVKRTEKTTKVVEKKPLPRAVPRTIAPKALSKPTKVAESLKKEPTEVIVQNIEEKNNEQAKTVEAVVSNIDEMNASATIEAIDKIEQKLEEIVPNEQKAEQVVTTQNEPEVTQFGELFDLSTPRHPTETYNRTSSDGADSTRTRTITPPPVFSDDEHDSGVMPETPSPPTLISETTIINTSPPQPNRLILLNCSDVEKPVSVDSVLSNGHNKIEHSSPPKESNGSNGNHALAGGVVLGLTEKLQQERDSRRAKLNEILSKTREQSTGASPIKTSNSDTGLDASSLAKQLLAKRNINAGQPEQNVLTLHDELASLGNEFTLPGQIPDTHNNNVTHQ